MHAFLQDFRYALRTLRGSQGLTAVIVTSLAIGIGATTAIFSVVNALLLKPLPYPDPDRTHGDGGFGTSRRRLRSALIVSEVAFSLMLLVGAGLLVRRFVRLQNVSPGFNPDNVISMRLGASGRQFPNRDAAVEFYRQFGDRIARLPGVTARGAMTSLPFTSAVGWGSINVQGFTPQPGQELQVDQRAATPDYFRAMDIPLLKGRFFSEFDTMQKAQPVVIVDEKFAQRFWPTENPVGKHVWRDPKEPLTIVGIVGTVKQYGLDIDGRIVVYRPSPGLLSYQVARTSTDPASVANAIVHEIHALDPTIPVYDIRTMRDRMKDSVARLATFSIVPLILITVAVLASYLPARRATRVDPVVAPREE